MSLIPRELPLNLSFAYNFPKLGPYSLYIAIDWICPPTPPQFITKTEAPVKESPESSLAPSTVWGHSEKTAFYQRKETLTTHSSMDFLASKTEKYMSIVFKPPSLGRFYYRNLNEIRRTFWILFITVDSFYEIFQALKKHTDSNRTLRITLIIPLCILFF